MILQKIKTFITNIALSLSVVMLTIIPLQTAPVYAAEEESSALGGLFSNCQLSNVDSGETAKVGECLKEIVNFIFVVAVFLLIFRIIGSQLGIIVDASGGGEGPIVATRKAIQDGIIGLLLIGAPVLFLNLFNTAATDLIFDFGDQSTNNTGEVIYQNPSVNTPGTTDLES